MLNNLFQYRQIDYQTHLTPDQIGQRLADNVITGFSFYTKKPYYGGFTSYTFSVRKTSSKFKQQSLGPNVDGSYSIRDGKTVVTLSLRPHPVLIGVLLAVRLPLVLYVVLGIGEFFKTWDIEPVIGACMPVLFWYGLFWFIFQVQISSSINFWERTLELHRNHP